MANHDSEVFTLSMRCLEYEQRLRQIGLQGHSGESLQRTNAELHEYIENLESRFNDTSCTLKETESELQECKEKISKAKELENKLIKGVRELNQGNSTLKNRNSILGQEKTALDTEVLELRDCIQVKKKREEELVEELAKKNNELEHLKKQSTDIKMNLITKENRIIKLTEEKQLVCSKYERLEQRQKKNNDTQQNIWHAKKNDFEAKLQMLRGENEASSMSLKELQRELKALKIELSIASETEKRLEKVKSGLSDTIDTLMKDQQIQEERFKNEIEKLAVDQQQKHSREIEKYKNKVDSLTKKYTECQKKFESLQTAWSRSLKTKIKTIKPNSEKSDFTIPLSETTNCTRPKVTKLDLTKKNQGVSKKTMKKKKTEPVISYNRTTSASRNRFDDLIKERN